jgi:hypothetical protein
MAMIDRNFTFATNGTVTANDLHNLIDSATIYQDLITGQVPITSVGTNYELLIADGTNPNAAPNAVTVYDLFEDALTAGTYTNANISAALTYGTATGTRLVSSNATITTGTITTGVIPTLTSSTATFGTTTSTAATITSGTITNLASTTGTIATLNSTTGTIGNLSTTLAGDFTISQGTGTLGTSGVTLGTYGGATSIPVLAIDAKGRITTASTSAITSGFTGFRNRIINGDMRIDQRNEGALITSPVSAQYLVDRFFYRSTQAAKVNAQQNAGSVTLPAGFINYLGITSTSAYSVLTTDRFNIAQGIEGLNVSDLGWGTAGAATVTLSFQVYSSLTGTFGGALKNSAEDRSYPFSYTISSANTWTSISINIAGDTSGTWLKTNGMGISVYWGLGCGSTTSGTAGAWTAGNLFSATSAVSVVGTNGATFYITGVQLEAGSTATEFERRPIGTELVLCQRYYQVVKSSIGRWDGATNARFQIMLQQQMRSLPSLSAYKQTVSLSRTGITGFTTTSFSPDTPLGTNQGGEVLVTTNNVGASAGEFAGMTDSTGGIAASSEL